MTVLPFTRPVTQVIAACVVGSPVEVVLAVGIVALDVGKIEKPLVIVLAELPNLLIYAD